MVNSQSVANEKTEQGRTRHESYIIIYVDLLFAFFSECFGVYLNMSTYKTDGKCLP